MKTHVAILQCIYPARPYSREDFETLKTLIDNTGVSVEGWNDKWIRLYGTPDLIKSATDRFIECKGGVWGTNVKAVSERFTITGPYELLEPKTEEPGR